MYILLTKIVDVILEFLIVLLPIIGVITGAVLAYLLNKKSSAMNLSLDRVLDKKIDLYEQLYTLLNSFNRVSQASFSYAKQNDNAKLAVSLEKVKESALEIMSFFENNDLYLDKDVIYQVGATCMVPAGLNINPQSEDRREKVDLLHGKYVTDYRLSVEIIREYMGLKRVERHLKNVNRSETTSAVLDYAHEIEKTYRIER